MQECVQHIKLDSHLKKENLNYSQLEDTEEVV